MLSPGMAHDGNTLRQRSLGGSETAAIRISEALAARGHTVTVCSPGAKNEDINGVLWVDINNFAGLVGTPHDVTVVSRALDALRIQPMSGVTVFWTHDLALRRASALLGSGAWQTQAFYVMSEFQKRQYLQVNPGLPPELFFVTRNGIDLRDFYALRALPRDRNVVLYGSRPERGLEIALNIFDVLRRRKSALQLHVAFYDNLVAEMKPLYDSLFSRAQQMPNVKILGPLLQRDWHVRLAQAGSLIYPSCPGEFREISCIAAMEAMAAGTPVVTANKGALPETCGPGAALYVGQEDTDPGDPEYAKDFAGALQALHDDNVLWNMMHERTLIRANQLDWADVAQEWEAHWYTCFDRRANDPWRIQRHYERLGDREALSMLSTV